MERSIKRVEKLVHATNSALAQMRLSLMFDDLNSKERQNFGTEDFHPSFGEKLLGGEDLKQCQKEFNSEASEMLAKIERIFGSHELSRRNSQALERIKEINRKMKTPALEQTDCGEMQQSRKKLLSLIGEEKFSPGVTSSKGSIGSRRSAPFCSEKKTAEKLYRAPKKAEILSVTAKTPARSKEELKSKILETQEIVDRGFQTARLLAHKVDSITKCERKELPEAEKTSSEINLKNLEGKMETNENVNTAKWRRHTVKEKKRKKDREEEVERPVNVQVIDIKRREVERSGRSNLRMQRLPSIHIKGELQLQKIHNLEISTGEDTRLEKSNTAVAFVSHERMEKEKMNEIIEKVRKENCCCSEDNTVGKYVECYHCGKLIRVCQTRVDPQKVDEILQMCNFNVFDPRIEEFVEKYGNVDGSKEYEAQVLNSAKVISSEAKLDSEAKAEEAKGKVKKENMGAKQTKSVRRFTLRDLSDQLYNKYRQEVDTIEGNHLKLDGILKNLFRKIDESREVFENCHLLKNQNPDSRRVPNLTVTKPVLVNFDGDSLHIMKNRKNSYVAESKNLSKDRSESHEVEMEGWRGASLFTKLPSGDQSGAETSLFCDNRGGNTEIETKKEIQGKLDNSTTHPRLKNIGLKSKSQERLEGPVSAKPTWTIVSRDSGKRKETSRRHSTEKHVEVFARTLKSSGQGDAEMGSLAVPEKTKLFGSVEENKWVLEEGELETPLVFPIPEGGTRVDFRDDRVEGLENVMPSAATSVSLKSISPFKNDEAEKKTLVESWNQVANARHEGKAPSEPTSERSENNYESDFESMTNELEERADEDREEEATEMFPLFNKLSAISEVDSELEKKLGDTPKASTSIIFERSGTTRVVDPLKVEVNALASEVSCRDKTEVALPKTAETELVTSLKDILLVLQDQFAKTESLADKLTEKKKVEKRENLERSPSCAEVVPSNQREIPNDSNLVENLKSARKGGGVSGSPRVLSAAEKVAVPGRLKPADSFSEDGGSSLGEIFVSQRRRRGSDHSESGSISENSFLKLATATKSPRPYSSRRETDHAFGLKLGVNSEDVSYSEGEIQSENSVDIDHVGIHSVGEISH